MCGPTSEAEPRCHGHGHPTRDEEAPRWIRTPSTWAPCSRTASRPTGSRSHVRRDGRACRGRTAGVVVPHSSERPGRGAGAVALKPLTGPLPSPPSVSAMGQDEAVPWPLPPPPDRSLQGRTEELAALTQLLGVA